MASIMDPAMDVPLYDPDLDATRYHEKEKLFEAMQRSNMAFKNNDDSNEGILQLGINVSKTGGKRLPAKKQELARFDNEFLIKDIAMDLRILRKKKVWYTILTDLVKSDTFSEFYSIMHPDSLSPLESAPEIGRRHFMRRGENVVLDHKKLLGYNNPPVLRWFSNFIEHLMDRDASLKNIRNDSTIGVAELGKVEGGYTKIYQEYLIAEKKRIHESEVASTNLLCKVGLDHLLRNTLNGLLSSFAVNHNMTFAPYSSKYKKSNDFSGVFRQMNTTGTFSLDSVINEHNKMISNRVKAYGGHGPVPSGAPPLLPPHTPTGSAMTTFEISPENPVSVPDRSEIETATMYDAIFVKTPDGVSVSNPVIPIDILLEAEALLVGGNLDREPEAEEGWEELAREFLPKHGLDPKNYGLEDRVPETPSSEMVTSTPSPYTPPSGSYEMLAIHEHQHPVPDASDVADATEAAITHVMEERESGENLEGGELLINSAQFANDILATVAPNIITEYNDTPSPDLGEPMRPNAGMSDEHADTPPRPSTPPIILPTIAEVLPHSSPLKSTPPTARVHHSPEHCNSIAERFISAWRGAKKRLYHKYGIRHFNINHALFRSGAVCHRCYELVRRHHERYHLKSGGTVRHSKLAYPRSRQEKKSSQIKENPHTKKYKETKKKAKEYTSKLVKKNASQLRSYNKHLKK